MGIDISLIKNLDSKSLLKYFDYSNHIKSKEFISYNVEKIEFFENRVDKIIMDLYNNNSKKKANRYLALSYFSKRFSTDEIYKMRKKNVIVIKNNTNEFISSKKLIEGAKEMVTNYYIPDFIYYVPFYNTLSNNPNIGYSKDSIIDGKSFKFFYYKSRVRTFVDNNESYYYYVSLCFNSEYLLDYIDMNLAVPYSDFLKRFIPKRVIYKFSDYSFENREEHFDNVFNPDNYKHFSKHDDKNPPYSYLYNEKDTILNDNVLNFPIVSLKGDTTTIQKENGWLLLDFWFFGCTSCKDWLYTLKQERDSLGYRVLEKKGIKIMSINSLSDNTEKILKEVSAFDAQDIIYHSKGISKYFFVRKMPYYILISPDKKIIHKSYNADNILNYIR